MERDFLDSLKDDPMMRAYRKRGAGVPNDVRKMVYRRDGFQCIACGDSRGLQIHHVVHRSVGGSDFPENLVTLCMKCHAAAHGMRWADYPDYIDAAWMEQTCVEYISDWVAENRGEAWYPFK